MLLTWLSAAQCRRVCFDIESPISEESCRKLDRYCEFALRRNPINHPSVMFKRARIIEVGGYLDMPFFEDYYLWIRCIVAGFKFHNVQRNLVFMRGGQAQLQGAGLSYAKYEYMFLARCVKSDS